MNLIKYIVLTLIIAMLIMGVRALILGYTPSNGYWDAPTLITTGLLLFWGYLREDWGKYLSSEESTPSSEKNIIIEKIPISAEGKKTNLSSSTPKKNLQSSIYHFTIFLSAICSIIVFLRSCK